MVSVHIVQLPVFPLGGLIHQRAAFHPLQLEGVCNAAEHDAVARRQVRAGGQAGEGN